MAVDDSIATPTQASVDAEAVKKAAATAPDTPTVRQIKLLIFNKLF